MNETGSIVENKEVILSSSQPVPARAGVKNREVLNQFRQQIHGLGALWILVGVLTIAGGAYLSSVADSTIPRVWLTAMLGLGCVWIPLGLFTCLKKMPALTVALLLSYATVVFSILNGATPGIFLVLGIFQGHRVRKMAKTLTAAGIALTTKP